MLHSNIYFIITFIYQIYLAIKFNNVELLNLNAQRHICSTFILKKIHFIVEVKRNDGCEMS